MVLAIIEKIHLVFIGFVAWYHFVQFVSLVLLPAFTAGVVAGIMFSNTLALYPQVSHPKVREFTLGYTSVATGNRCIYSRTPILGLIIESWLRNHCLRVAKKGITV